MPASLTYSAVVPAAGVGRRFGGAVPKQYLPIDGRTVMEHTLSLLLSLPQLAEIIVVVHPADDRWRGLALLQHRRVRVVPGGAERCHSVLAGVIALDATERVLVHDVARPCCPPAAIERLIRDTAAHPVGGILALPVSDTLKRVEEREIAATVDRTPLWAAQTPQLFDRALLRKALETGLAAGRLVTDEAQAMETLGMRPLVVEGSPRNIKITRPDDLALATYYLANRPLSGALV